MGSLLTTMQRDNVAPFLPTDITNLILWLDAADVGTITESSGAVSQWADKSSAGNNASQSTGSEKPTTGSATQNGNNLLSFDGTEHLAISPIAPSAATVFTVFKNTDAANGSVILSRLASGSSYVFQEPTRFLVNFASGGFTATSPSITDGQFHICTGVCTGTSATAYANGNAGTPVAGTMNWQIDRIGSYVSSVINAEGELAEVLLYERALTVSELNQVGAYLSQKWGNPEGWTTI